ncbi:efflux RND transporter periplasmic adaptor subunit [Methylobacterium segetis]|uniref:efflux RND transporter periplasmic adaptor subunit n=1 Tax=Methylobacterium segetis TaxID=2488750 RepID=UPI00104B951E|nr:HlyD family secretion protein [Methylobacterium segetis]
MTDPDPRSRPDADPLHAAEPAASDAPILPARRRVRLGRILRLVATALVLVLAAAAAAFVWSYYVTAPWTRDGQVRVQVASVAPQVSGQIVELRVTDNQTVRQGDILYRIDPFDYEVAIASAEAELKNREADLQVKRTQAQRREQLTTLSTSVEEKQQYEGTAKIAEAALDSAKAQLSQAKINLARTEVRSPVNGRVTNLLLRNGDYATKGTVNVAVIDTDSFWIDGYFEETKMPHIRVGDRAEAVLMGFGESLRGTVESVTLGISTANAAPSTQGLPSVNPVYTWVRLAQRVPVRIRIDHVPEGITLVAGMTCTVSLGEAGLRGRDWLLTAWARLRDQGRRPPREN